MSEVAVAPVQYKESGVQWLGKIPAHWEVKRIKDLSELQSGETITSQQLTDEGYPVYGGNGKRGYFSRYNLQGEYILIGRQGALCGNINYASGKFWASEHAVVVYKDKAVNTVWYGELLRIMNLNQYSLAAAQPGLSVDKIKRLELPFAPVAEQEAIADYILDHTAAIDRKIDLLGQKIKLYQTLRKTLINETVCRGLHPHAPRKDSGIEWIGEIPAHWQVRRLKDVGRVVLGKMLNNTGKAGYALKPYLKSKNITWLRPSIKVVDDMYFSPDELLSYRIKKNDLLVSEGGEVGKTCIWNDELPECYIQNSVHKITILPGNSPQYYLYLSFAMGAVGFYDSIVNQVSIKHLTWEKFIRVLVLVPPYEEQQAIAEHIEQGTRKIDAVITNLTTQIATLKELRKTLINDVVTGKLNVTA